MLRELLNNEFTGELTEGAHSAILYRWDLITNDADPSKDYMRMNFKVQNAGQTQNYTRNMFERDMSMMLSQLRRQFKRENETIRPIDFLKELINDQTEFNIYIEYVMVPTQRGVYKRVQNVHFQPAPEKVEAKADEDMEVPAGA